MAKKKQKFFLDIIESFKKGEQQFGMCKPVLGGDYGNLKVPTEFLNFKTPENIFLHFEPTEDNEGDLFNESKSYLYWGSGVDKMDRALGKLTSLRETILLFCAFINNEY